MSFESPCEARKRYMVARKKECQQIQMEEDSQNASFTDVDERIGKLDSCVLDLGWLIYSYVDSGCMN
jgi:hypothetical protein